MNLGGVPEPYLAVLVGASGAGKSTWAAQHFRRAEVVSSDDLRAVVGSGSADLDATADAFAVLDLVLGARVRRRLTTVVDTLGLDPQRRLGYLELARRAGLPSVAVVLDTDAALCRSRNRERDRPVPAPALAAQLRKVAELAPQLDDEGWDAVVHVDTSAPVSRPAPDAAPAAEARQGLRFVLQVSRFPWGDDPAAWLESVALAADSAGFDGLALMDHLIQIPQVGRAWEPIPEPWVTLGLLAGLPTRLELGTLVSPASLHLAGRLAKSAATLDVLTGGRAFCGVGAGWWEREHLGYGVPFRPPAERDCRPRTLPGDVARAVAAGHEGVRGRDGRRCRRRRCTRGRSAACPIIVGGRGPRVLALAARLGRRMQRPASITWSVRAR